VITESVTAFPADKQRAVNEYARVVKPGGYVGLNETIWLKEPVPPEIIAWVSQDRSSTPMPQTHEAWIRLLEQAGLEIISAEAHSIDTKEEARGMLARYGLGGILRVLGRTLRLYLRSADYRQFVSSVHEDGILPDEVNDYFGYGLYVGRKKE
ncbi:MAG: hypothetical protein JW750_09075, partial [Anaerolineaceae bacterium]|nr:hypothetical protein [Anaerolineaceae bacterium]